MAYLTRTEFLDRYDHRRVGSLVKDDDTRKSKADMITGDDVLDAALADGESYINAALFAANRYEASDLDGLTGDDAAILKRLNADLAYGFLLKRRGYSSTALESEAPGYGEAMGYLEALRTGERILNLTDNKNAGLPKNQKLSTKITLVTGRSNRYFGSFLDEATQDEPPFS